MPAMPRPKGKPKKIAYKILGVPANIQDKKSPTQKRIYHRLQVEDAQRVR